MIHVRHLQRRWLFALLDLAGVYAVFYVALLIRAHVPLPFFQGLLPISAHPTFVELIVPISLTSFFYIFILYIVGIYDLWATSSPVAWAQRLLPPNAVLLACAFASLYVLQKFDFPRSLLLTVGVCNFAFGLAWRLFYFKGVESSVSQVVLVGSLQQCERMAHEFTLPPFQHRVVVTAHSKSAASRLRKIAAVRPVGRSCSFRGFRRNMRESIPQPWSTA